MGGIITYKMYAILKGIYSNPEGMQAGDVIEKTEIPAETIYNIFQHLERTGLIEYNKIKSGQRGRPKHNYTIRDDKRSAVEKMIAEYEDEMSRLQQLII